MSQTIDVLTGAVIKKPAHSTSAYLLFYQAEKQTPKLFAKIEDHPDYNKTTTEHYIWGFTTGWNSGDYSVLKVGAPESKRRFFKEQSSVTTYLAPHANNKQITKNWFHSRKWNNSRTTVTSNIKGRDVRYEIRVSCRNERKLFSP